VSGASTFGVWLLRTSLESSVLIALVFTLRFALRRRLAPRWQYALWLLVVLRLALPVVPASPTSVFNLVSWRPRVLAAPAMAPPSATSAPAPAAIVVPVLIVPAASGGLDWRLLLFGVWAAVAALLLVRLGLRSYRLTSRVCRQRPVTRPDVVDLLEDCKQALGVHIPINVVQSAEVATPALLGFLRPRLLLPERLLETFDGEALRLLFLHELAHVKRRDILVNWLATLVHVLHWFNPLVALAMARMRADRELATDSLVLSDRGEAHNRSYGETLIRLVEFAAAPSLLPGTVGVLEDKAELRRRVTMIATHKAGAYRRSLLAAGVLLALAATTFTGSVKATDAQSAVGGAASSQEAESARRALTAWLGLVDSGQYGPSWEQASEDFRTAVKRADWEKGVAAVRGPLGAVVSRTLRSAAYKTSMPGAPDGEYVVVESETAFENAASTIETGTLKKEKDGEWRAIGYFVRPNVDTSAAEKALGDWLAMVDAEKYGPSWEAASADFRAAVTRADWERALQAARSPLGAVISRRTQSAMAHDNLPGAPAGHYVVVQTEARFARKASAVETCTLQQGADGGWRVGGYFIR
jgi:beta-lactamase regulating signal transducer with metallopeptidase domain